MKPGGLLLGFFYRLRARGLKVTPHQWLALVEGLARGLHGSSLMGFYSLARCLLVKDEGELDDFDQAFAEHFQGAPEALPGLEAEVLAWLESPIPPYQIDPELRRVLDQVDVEALRAELERRLREQQERHDGGDYWVGTGGTSAFGHSGYHPGGIRIGGQGRFGSAVQVAGQRRFREHRRDLLLDTRQLAVALKKLRALTRVGPAEELDVDGTIDRTAREAGELALLFRPPRQNQLGLLLAMDVGGSMEPYRRLVDVLFSAAHGARHFKRFAHVYFHNCVYAQVYADAAFSEPIPLAELLRRFPADTRLVLVGDAHMYPGELLDRHGAIQWDERNEEPGLVTLRRLAAHFHHAAWLNPMRGHLWEAPSVTLVRSVFPMYPLSVAGVAELAEELARKAPRGSPVRGRAGSAGTRR
ncbi:MAG TPA: VWA domain-containing protein [Myxococcota bacterium]|nr:VWA domain-containing protein [Myxococcota bacterium]HRY94783.1 VWA domain-containing protein [Myxococcota bacterium]